ncbi:hypothetical protein BBOH_0944 [Bifidobacterium bohemicum DSM 22767]|uniref:Uncharacterized protein n=2 Tax=Bifidobacterium bohemicum TaxID=638617 RepID=A0A086ZGJ3_9BIFI|nr:hypothetical protein BBOH_0944 [Bifidobacterium bohemicum DSM 22767]
MPGTSPVHPTNDSDNGQNGVSSDEHDMGIPPLSFPLAGN